LYNVSEQGAVSQNGLIRIIPFSTEYTQSVVDLIVGIQQGEFHLPITANDQPDLSDIPNYYQKGNGNFWLALHQGNVVGTISLLDIGNQQAALRKMFVDSSYRGGTSGAAGKLLDTLMAWARNNGIREIYLGTTPFFLAAHRFYEKNGFTEVTVDDLPASFPVMSVDKKFYQYTV
jgi:N-acetylglutamate synthase-like GNAT family acetyltransferase